METVLKVRCWILRGEKSIRQVSRETGVSRNTIRKYLKDDGEPRYQRHTPAPLHKLLGKHADKLRSRWEHDLKLPRRERRTGKKLYEELVGEGYKGSYSTTQRLIRELKHSSSGSRGAFVPLQFAAGDAVQFDWSEEHVVLGGVPQKVKIAHFRLCHSRKPFVYAYPSEVQEMVLDAFVRALAFYGGVPRRVIIDNPKTMVTYVSRSKERMFHARFLACMNHYVMEPVACTPASGWEKGQVENQVGFIRAEVFTPKLSFDDLDSLNEHLERRCQELGERAQPGMQDRTIDAVFAEEVAALRPLGQPFDGYIEKSVRVRSTCLVQYDNNRYSVPCQFAGQQVSLRAYAGRIVLVADHEVIAGHKRRFTRNISYFEPWHYVPLLDRKPGALRNGAPFVDWQLPNVMMTIRDHYMQDKGGDRYFVDLLLLAHKHGTEVIEQACKLAVKQNTLRLPAIINLINQLQEPEITPLSETGNYPLISTVPQADCKRYEALYEVTA